MATTRCSCHHPSPAPLTALPARFTGEQTVAEVTQASARALEVFQAWGINHCCGAHLTLAQAAASAGAPIADLLEALNRA
jgi:iron-sulfur cluster repair protein YtfE (RIC family)